jgi:hypothetical protein
MKRVFTIVALFFCAMLLFSDDNEDVKLRSKPLFPSDTKNDIDISLGLIGLSYFSDVNGAYRLLPNFGPIIRVSKNLWGDTNLSIIDVGGIVYANYATSASISESSFFVVGLGASIGFMNQAITISPGYSWIINDSLNSFTFSIIVTSTSFKFK